ncbi:MULTISPECIES: thioredoxin family protein [unclassified Methylibium]|uniref:protein-disulfide reductase DsbD family protein n=1 Tax=unclassified Methylibium TaxID=2633235 RepID=UPI0003F3DA36|nr:MULTISPECIES: thioredoxin family protein [unclassified Methylibium]EWS54849.1 Thiol:disulfide interchange protein DsbD precursor [Methylibium sp. T29]EWS60205.1 Thiol:disulfide interchange protein DsbD precursor [Methylibium sp. T29-B]
MPQPFGPLFVAALASAALLLGGAAHAAAVRTDHVTAELVAERGAVAAGQTLRIGLKLQHIPHWHTYWRNPGDSGLPTTLSWTLPPGSRMGEIEWPAPERLPIGPLVNYGYEGEVLLPLQYTAPPDARPGDTLRLQAQARWLVCNDVCIPEQATLDLRLPVAEAAAADNAAPAAHAALFAQAAAAQAGPLSAWTAEVQQAGRDLLLTLEPAGGDLPADAPEVHVFPYAEQLLEPASHALYRGPRGYALKLKLLEGATVPARLDGIAVAQADPGASGTAVWGGPQRSVEFSAPLRPVATITVPAGARAAAEDRGPASLRGSAPVGLLAALGLAFLGGMLLNLMPCVFPVLSIKLLGLARQEGDARRLRMHALAYGVGVVCSFVALAAALLALRAAGSAVGWGFQLQEPGVVFALALLFFVLGLNLAGQFEFGLLMPQGLAQWRAQRPAVDAFGSGVLAVVAASPCTAPFMGAALGYAIAQPPAQALGVFAALGLGMAWPYVLLVLRPGWRARLPRPGPWMLRLKQGLAFPMFATVVWLLWVLGQQAGIDGSTRALVALVGLAFGLWLASVWRGVAARAGVTVLLVAVLAWGWPVSERAASPQAGNGTASTAGSPHAAWQAYDEAAIDAHLAQGRAVFVDFTAAWCVSCQVNKRLVLHTDETLQAFTRSNVALMRADWTHRDERITAALGRLGRNGVPVYVLMRPGREPLLLPEILTGGLVREALSTL